MFYLSSCARYGVPYLTPHLGELTSVLASPLFLSSECILLQEDVLSLISSLGLVQVGSEEERQFQKVMAESEFSRYLFCDQWKDSKARELVYSRSLCRELYLRNRRNSKYVSSSATNYSSNLHRRR